MKFLIALSVLASFSSAFASTTTKIRVTCYQDGAGKSASVQAVGIKNGILSGVEVDRSNPDNVIFKETFSAPAEGCFVEAESADMHAISAK